MSMNNNSNQQNLCKQGCGFYGNAQNMDMCSKCYENFLKTSSNQEDAPHSQSANQLSPYGSSQISINDIYQPHQTSTTTSTDKSNNVIHGSQHRKRQIAQSFLMEYSGGHKVPKSCKIDSKQYAEGNNQITDIFTTDDTAHENIVDHKRDQDDVEASAANSIHSAGPILKKPRRCEFCRRKVGLTGFDCRCGGHYCSVHRYSDKHSCTFDYQAHGQEQIKHQNPMICGTKIKKI